MTSTLNWEPPAPGPWQQDSAHNPVAQTALLTHQLALPRATAQTAPVLPQGGQTP